MTDQTRWGIDMQITENKAIAHAEQKSMRDELAFFAMNCTHFQMQELYSEMKRMKRKKNRYGPVLNRCKQPKRLWTQP